MTYSLHTLSTPTSRTASAPPPSGPARLGQELGLLLGLATLVFCVLALLSYSSQDPAWTTSGVNAGVWFGAVVKTGTTAVVVERLNDAIHQAMKDPEVVKRFADQGMQAFPSTPAQFGSFMQSELTKWGPLVKASGASIE